MVTAAVAGVDGFAGDEGDARTRVHTSSVRRGGNGEVTTSTA